MKLLRSEKVRSVLVAVGAIGVIFWATINAQPSSAVGPTLTLSIAGGDDAISLNISSLNGNNGTFRTSDTATNNISVFTNNYTGYTLGILAKVDGSTALINQSDNTKTLPSITATVSPTNYADDTYAEANSLNNTWGYKPSTLYDSTNDTNVSNTDYLPVPTSTETANQTIIAKTTSANTSGSTDGYNIAIGARVNNDTPPGAYTNTFVITAVANNISYTINYDANAGSDAVTNMPAIPQQEVVDATTPTITLPSNKPERDGYAFKGWCTVQVADDAACSGTEYQPGGSYNVDYTTNTVTLHARWKEAELLWDKVVEEWAAGGSRVQTNDTDENTGIQATITTANSGVFKYNFATDAFGVDSDNTKPDGTKADIYYFRGILDSNLSGTSGNRSFGSMGDGVTWPNYVKLGDTCWRIVRTTGSGGVKMIYNGLYSGGTTANSCANATTDAQLPSNSAFGVKGGSSQTSPGWTRNINRVGYTFNNDASIQDSTTSTSVDTVFGSNSNYSTTNTTDSAIKGAVENWFTSNISTYESILEPNAGYCNDRSAFSDAAGSSALSSIRPYASASAVMYFGALARNRNSAKAPTLGCPRGVVDLYTFKTDNDTNLNGGNGQLSKPVALLTADELSFAGSGGSKTTDGSAYHANSYLRSGSHFWLLSPFNRDSLGTAYESYLRSNGYLNGYEVSYVYGVRPAISLDHETAIESGDGTAVSPWVIAAP